MNRELLVKFLINSRFILGKLAEKINQLLQPSPKVTPAYIPVRVKPHPALRNKNDR